MTAQNGRSVTFGISGNNVAPLRLAWKLDAALFAGLVLSVAGRVTSLLAAEPAIESGSVNVRLAAVVEQKQLNDAVVPEAIDRLGAHAGSLKSVRLGGLSDLWRSHADPAGEFWTLTDRGPNGTVVTPDGKRRTLLEPDFVPVLVHLRLQGGFDHSRRADDSGGVQIQATEVLPLVMASGRPASGRKNDTGSGDPLLNAADAIVLENDSNGLDPEGLVRLSSGQFWLSEEYQPSLVEVSGDGQVIARFIPLGQHLPGAGCDIFDVLPAEYAFRKDNRGFESMAVSPDELTLWAAMQSPLDYPFKDAGRKTGNVRVLQFNPVARRPTAEFLYRLGSPKSQDFLSKGNPPGDGKISAMVAIGAATLLVLEQMDGGASIYEVSLEQATNTLERTMPAGESLEMIRDLSAAAIRPAGKRLLADLSPHHPRMVEDVFREYGGGGKGRSIKLEGMALIDSQHVAILNDEDFGVDSGSETGELKASPRSCLWVVKLPAALAFE